MRISRKRTALLLSLGLLAGMAGRLLAHDMKPPETFEGVRSFDVYHDRGKIFVLTLDADPSGKPSLNCHVADERGDLTSSVRVASDVPVPDYGDHPGDDVQLAAFGSHLVALWQVKGTGWMGCGPIVCSVSSDGGRHWRPGRSPADDGTAGGHGFMDVTADETGVFHAVWLDGRQGHQSLYYARSTDFGATWSKNHLLRDKSCECCWNKITTAGKTGVYVLFRDQKPRDMAMAVSLDGGRTWDLRPSLGGFGWDFNGCPHVGGGLASSPGKLHALVWTGKDDVVGLYYLTSRNGNQWSRPQRLGDAAARHDDLAASVEGRLAAVWDAYEGSEFVIEAATSNDNGATWSTPRRLSRAGTRPSHPRVVPSGNGFEALWTEERSGASTLVTAAVK